MTTSEPYRIIETVTAFIGTDATGEGLCAFFDEPRLTWLPMVCADKERVDQMRVIAQAIADQAGLRIELVEFETRVHRQWINPNPT